MVMTGEVLGHYRVLEKIGSGGMGEVYLARDDRLGRSVAIKVLKPSLACDRDRLRRFEQEARAAAALNHPNIVAVYDFGVQDGAPYIVTEALEGETLRQRLYGGALSLRQAADFGTQIAHALVAAHEKKIVHRDLKPENLFVLKDGRIKVLDFGVAKLTTEDGFLEQEAHDAAALMTTQTKAGTLLGTVAYMSPEQLRGQSVDGRSDIFSLGSILYEMVTGRRAFQGETDVDTITAVLKEEPPPVSMVRENLPIAFEQVICHCLEKDPIDRFQSARDLGFALGTVVDSSTARHAMAVRRAKLAGRKAVIWVALALLMAAGGILLGRQLKPASAPEFHRLSFERGTIFSARFAPDGRSVLYSASWNGRPSDVYATINGSLVARPLSYPQTQLLTVSKENELALALNANNGSERSYSYTLASAPLVGGTPRPVLENVSAADWGPHGQLAVVHHVEGQVRVEFPIGKVLYQNTGWIGNLRVSPSGEQLAFIDHPIADDDLGTVCVVDLNGKRTVLSSRWESLQGLGWSPDGKEIWFSAVDSGNTRLLHAVDLSQHQRTLLSAPAGITLQDIASDGRVLVTVDDERLAMDFVSHGSHEVKDLSWFNWTIAKDVSRDGLWVYFEESGEPAGPNYAVGIRKADGSLPIRLGDGAGGGLSPDGKWALAVIPSAPPQLVMYPIGPGQPVEVHLPGIDRIVNPRFLADGKHIFFSGAQTGRPRRTFVVETSGEGLRPVTPEGQSANVPSPDGKYVVSRLSDTSLELLPLDGGEPRPVSGVQPLEVVAQWSEDGRGIYVYSRAEVPLHVFRLDIATGKRQLVQTLAPVDRDGVVSVAPIAMNPGLTAFAYSYDQILSTMYQISGLR